MTITFPAGTTEFIIPVLTALDGVAEMDEHFTVTLTNPSEGFAVGDTATINIMDDTGTQGLWRGLSELREYVMYVLLPPPQSYQT